MMMALYLSRLFVLILPSYRFSSLIGSSLTWNCGELAAFLFGLMQLELTIANIFLKVAVLP